MRFLALPKPAGSAQFGLFRIIFGLFLFICLAEVLPWAGEIYSRDGMIADAGLNYTSGKLPNLLERWDSQQQVIVFVTALGGLSILLTAGISRCLVAAVLWYGWFCLLGRNNLTSDPSLPFIGWLLLALAVAPSGEKYALFSAQRPDWHAPKILHLGAWTILALSYSASGFDKWLHSPSWREGVALRYVLESPLARPGFLNDWILSMPAWCVKGMTWFGLATEVFFAPACLFRWTRQAAWFAMTGLHLGLLLFVDFTSLSMGMLVFHLFVFDTDWLPSSGRSDAKFGRETGSATRDKA